MNPQLTTRLRHLRLSGMAEALPLRVEQAKAAPLEYLDFLDLLVQDELTRRADRLFARRLKQAASTGRSIRRFRAPSWSTSRPRGSFARITARS